MSDQPPQNPQDPQDPQLPNDVAPPGYDDPTAVMPAGEESPPKQNGHMGPWIVGAAVVLVLGALLAVVINNEGANDTQTVVTVAPTVNTTTVQRTGPTITSPTVTQPGAVTQETTVVVPPVQTVTSPPKTVTSPAKTVTTG